MALALPAGRRGQMLALTMTLLVAAAVWADAIAPALDWYGNRAELPRRQHAMAPRMAPLVETLPTPRRDAASLNGGPDANAPAVLLAGASDPLAAASLQQRIEEFAAQAGVHVGIQENLPAQAEGDLRAISVRLTLSAGYRGLVALLLALAGSDTPMVVDELLLRGLPGKADEETSVDASVTVTSWRSAKAGP